MCGICSLLVWELLVSAAQFTSGFAQEQGESPCEDYPYFKFEKVLNNNLGGFGPNTAEPEGLFYRCTRIIKGQPPQEVDLEFHAVSLRNPYDPGPGPNQNGFQGKYASIEVKTGTQVDLNIDVYDAKTHQRLILPEVGLTFFDLDTEGNKSGEEFVMASGFHESYLTADTEVKQSVSETGRTIFSGTVVGDYTDNPTSPWNLKQEHKRRAVSFEYRDVEEFGFALGSSGGTGKRFFNFVAWPSLKCDEGSERDEADKEILATTIASTTLQNTTTSPALPDTTTTTTTAPIAGDDIWGWAFVGGLALLPLLTIAALLCCLRQSKQPKPARAPKSRGIELKEPDHAPAPAPKKTETMTVLVPQLITQTVAHPIPSYTSLPAVSTGYPVATALTPPSTQTYFTGRTLTPRSWFMPRSTSYAAVPQYQQMEPVLY
mmetsp:Transcript_44104/g.93909  ORF Transcript_44104/g.93909 Transcript_44104/m.93909 type:complete len:431 (-) Transcript_44104:42-1334(-)